LGLKVSDDRIAFYSKALDDLTPTQIEHGFETARRHLGTFLPSVEQLRTWAESWRPHGPDPASAPPSRADLAAAGVTWRVSPEEIAQWLEAGKQAQRDHIAALERDPKWQHMAERFIRRGR